eukprot:TRINITY_DN28_c0_g1_i1.p1 TRINITY_DN28_c0_g1~~TRINITY_DN28_c0_g1_i1.p1  ORF type:complete len:181 (+),score=15.44 TRINITY_DN28_c0_g1_i1:44-544(+)
MGTRVWVGDLEEGLDERDLEDFFRDAGKLRNVWVARRPPGYAFVDFEDPRDAEDAVRNLDGKEIKGKRCRVELARDPRDRRERGPPGGRNCYECGEPGHFARECPRRGGSGGRGGYGDRDRDRDRDRGYDRGGYGRRDDDRRRSRSRSRSRSPRRYRSRSRSPGRR